MKPFILLAEDTKDTREYLVRALSPIADVDAVTDGPSAFHAYTTREHMGEPHDLIILDVAMPEMDGFEVAEAIRAHGGNAVPIVLLTAYSEPETVGRATRSKSKVWAKEEYAGDKLVPAVLEVLNAR